MHARKIRSYLRVMSPSIRYHSDKPGMKKVMLRVDTASHGTEPPNLLAPSLSG